VNTVRNASTVSDIQCHITNDTLKTSSDVTVTSVGANIFIAPCGFAIDDRWTSLAVAKELSV